jgi:hypothetical protein
MLSSCLCSSITVLVRLPNSFLNTFLIDYIKYLAIKSSPLWQSSVAEPYHILNCCRVRETKNKIFWIFHCAVDARIKAVSMVPSFSFPGAGASVRWWWSLILTKCNWPFQLQKCSSEYGYWYASTERNSYTQKSFVPLCEMYLKINFRQNITKSWSTLIFSSFWNKKTTSTLCMRQSMEITKIVFARAELILKN